MNYEVACVLALAIEAAYGRYDDVNVFIFRVNADECGVEVHDGEENRNLLTVNDCIDYIKDLNW